MNKTGHAQHGKAACANSIGSDASFSISGGDDRNTNFKDYVKHFMKVSDRTWRKA